MEVEQKEIKVKSLVENKSGETKQRKLLCDVPSKILAITAGKLSFADCIDFWCVNRLYAFIGNSTVPMRTTNTFFPCLIFLERSRGFYSFVDYKRNAKYSLSIPEALKDHAICRSEEGSLLMDKETSIATFNPITKETLQYPYVQSIGYAFSSFIFTPYPSSSSDSLAIVEGLPFF